MCVAQTARLWSPLVYAGLPCVSVCLSVSRQGTLKVGDRILKINAVDVREATHAEALALLRACTKQLTLEIEFDVTVHGMGMEMYWVTWEWGYT